MICNNTYANQVGFDFKLDSDFQYQNIAPFVEIYGDTSLIQDFDFILENTDKLNFEINGQNGIHKGVSRSIFWLKFPITNTTQFQKDLVLKIRESNIHALQLFVVKKDTIEKSILTGDYFPLDERPIPHRYFLFPVELPSQETVTCYLMAEKRSQSLNFNLELWDKIVFLESNNTDSFIYGVILGLMILYLGISLFLFLFFPQRLTAYYLMVVLFLILSINTMEGVGFQFLWSKVPIIVYDYFRSFTSVIQFIFLTYFLYEFLKDKFQNYIIYKILGFLTKLTVVLFICVSFLFLFLEINYPKFRNFDEGRILSQGLLSLQFLFHIVSFIIIICLSILNFFQNRNFENFALSVVIILYFVLICLISVNLFGMLNTGPNFYDIVLISFIIEIATFSILLFSKFWTLSTQKEILIFVSSQNELKIANTLLQGQANERLRIADNLQSQLQPLLIQSQSIFRKEVLSNQSSLIQKIDSLIQKSQGEVNRIANNLIPQSIYHSDLTNNIHELCQNIDGSKVIKIGFYSKNMSSKFPINLRVNIYRIVQELLNNVIKHALATKADVSLHQENNLLKITVEDDGIGLEENEYMDPLLIENKFGSLRFRIESMNGEIHFSKSELSGLKVDIQLPVQ